MSNGNSKISSNWLAKWQKSQEKWDSERLKATMKRKERDVSIECDSRTACNELEDLDIRASKRPRSEMVLPCDWQVTTQKIAQRGQYLLETGQWSDCKFIVGQEPHQQIIEGHKVFLAMSSPVFEAMFYGAMAEKNDPIPIRDVQPEAFKALMEYIYTDRVDLGSFELACELCYCAKKYMLPFLVEECTKFLWSDLSLKKACRAYEFAKLFEEPILMDKCMQIICSKTDEVLKESSWEEVEQGTVLTLLDQEELYVSSETVLFNALERWAKAECNRKSLDSSDPKALRSVIGNALTKIRFLNLTPKEFAEGPGKSALLMQEEAFSILMNISSPNSKVQMPEGFSMNKVSRSKAKSDSDRAFTPVSIGPLGVGAYASPIYPPPSNLIMPVRRSFSMECPHNSASPALFVPDTNFQEENREVQNRESQEVPNEILITNIRDRPKFYCLRSTLSRNAQDCRNYDVMDSSVTFTVDRNIFILGVQVPSQLWSTGDGELYDFADVTYTEVLYAHLLDSDGTRLTYTHYTTKAHFRDSVEISFNRPVYIQKNKLYKVGVVFNKPGWYPNNICAQRINCENISFTYNIGVNGIDYVRDGLIRSIVFTYR
ncbi:BTB/POZ domain-containing protein 2-like isoform X1 [Trichogramma pretiosum]|uniref:BTB/POZ domain-containing protein 2-like isoform X1 n=1 Tax=Trichogramma pretiosum TaxID=7493 RepID=UPI0006C9C668|nr:BTB/POZ domain-containing protein 2-like isoform X1 [Trichogramma pretiosum]